MNIPATSGQVVYLAGPSSSGKSHYSSELIRSGWLHFEADHFLSFTELNMINERPEVQAPGLKIISSSPNIWEYSRLNLKVHIFT